jgi:hypothetical protein
MTDGPIEPNTSLPAAFRAAFSLEHQMTDIVALKAANAHCWQVAKIAPKRQAEVSAVAVSIVPACTSP